MSIPTEQFYPNGLPIAVCPRCGVASANAVNCGRDELRELKEWCEAEAVRLRGQVEFRTNAKAFALAYQSSGAMDQMKYMSHRIDCILADREVGGAK